MHTLRQDIEEKIINCENIIKDIKSGMRKDSITWHERLIECYKDQLKNLDLLKQ